MKIISRYPPHMLRAWHALVIIIALTVFSSCAILQRSEIDPADAERFKALAEECHRQYPDITWITLSDFLSREDRNEWVLLDVRSPEERAVSIIPGALSPEVFEKSSSDYTDKNILV